MKILVLDEKLKKEIKKEIKCMAFPLLLITVGVNYFGHGISYSNISFETDLTIFLLYNILSSVYVISGIILYFILSFYVDFIEYKKEIIGG